MRDYLVQVYEGGPHTAVADLSDADLAACLRDGIAEHGDASSDAGMERLRLEAFIREMGL